MSIIPSHKKDDPVSIFKIESYLWAPIKWQDALIEPNKSTVTEEIIDYIRRVNHGIFPVICIDEPALRVVLKDMSFPDGTTCCLYATGDFIRAKMSNVPEYEMTIHDHGFIYKIPTIYFSGGRDAASF